MSSDHVLVAVLLFKRFVEKGTCMMKANSSILGDSIEQFPVMMMGSCIGGMLVRSYEMMCADIACLGC